ncbi:MULTISPECIES: acyl-CoA dehydrogenase family protein [Mycolicibacterium]|uniref:Acyl-CoA dehydrogenase domain protein n=3 Tax=Mycolicibacterium TaxID=1866885 RepID=A0QZP1_MYCS2|nr:MULTISPECIES: acyl-CoA dehydrogenase family protein [Mycolicibacterium]ABK74734.1 acyl-CoA dehydrogenase domain protein [Mycolicibacterium smegmatis MC2 155]AFP40456.1 Acyl-CoA dehydrogenase [Mycolicibacterium smegmatis MC2 155]AIU09198.1 acyl-CoA dehydrogenase [Mycolicibacterium smegmatis MC2 155]AIU15823.1 acyl-CoA dehydrogenase [Mycolicibacterium smegmatis]AIU22446.1 acyl-CoA dehydrogenase [Mycolicibacterium smegmatis]
MTSTQPTELDEALVRIRAVFDALAEGAAERDQANEHPYALVSDLAGAGFGRLRLPREFGGFGVDLPTLFALLAEAGQADSNLPQIWRGHFTTTEILLRECDQDARRHWSEKIAAGAVFGNAQSEPSSVVAGIDPTDGCGAITTRVRINDRGRRVVSGTKFYSTGSRFADYIRAAVLDEQGRRRFVVIPARHPGVDHVDDWDGIGQRQTGSGTTILTDVPVEPHGCIGHHLHSVQGLDSFVQIVHLANLTGIARSIVAETVDIVRTRTRTSRHALTQSAANDPDVLAVIGKLQARRLTAEVLLDRAARRLEAAHAAGDEDSYAEAYTETSTAQVAVIEAVLDAATTAFDAGGSSAVRTRVHLDRHWRNARTLASHNPVIYKPRVIGDFLVNGNRPVSGYYNGHDTGVDAS